MELTIAQAHTLMGTVILPSDKSIVQRAVLIAALADGETEIAPWPDAEDCQRVLQIIEGLGVVVARSAGAVQIRGRGAQGFHAPDRLLDCGESGTAFRLAAGLLAGQPFTSRLGAADSLSRRPMRRIVEPLSRMGAEVEGRRVTTQPQECYPPLTIHGRRPLRAIRYELPVASAQVKSAILLAGLSAEGPTTIVERHPTRDHTERLLARCGIQVETHDTEVAITPGLLRAPGRLVPPGDFSSAAFFIIAAACVPGARVVLQHLGLNPTRTALLRVLERMGAQLEVSVREDTWEPRGTLTVSASSLRGVTIEPHEIPELIDELPALMVAAACAKGTTRLLGVGELRLKETDRVQSMQDGLQRLGVPVRLLPPDGLEVEGGSPLTGAVVESAGDHRTAMSLAVAGLLARGVTTIRGAECVAKSFPGFFREVSVLTGGTNVGQGR